MNRSYYVVYYVDFFVFFVFISHWWVSHRFLHRGRAETTRWRLCELTDSFWQPISDWINAFIIYEKVVSLLWLDKKFPCEVFMRSILSKNLSKYEIIDLCSRYYSVAIFYAIAAIATFVQLIALIGLIYFNYSFHLHRFLYHTHWIFSLHFLTMPKIGERLEFKNSSLMRLYKGQLQKFIKM